MTKIGFDVEFAGGIGGAHVADGAEDGTFGPGAIIPAKAPEDSGIGVGIAAVDGVAIVEFDHDFQGFLGRAGPFEDFFAPEHAHVIVHFTFAEELGLGGVPEGIVGARGGELLKGVAVFALVTGVSGESLFGPVGE